MTEKILDDDGHNDVDGGNDDNNIYNMMELMTISDSFQFESKDYLILGDLQHAL